MSVPPESPDESIVPGWSDAPVSGDRIDLHEGPIIAGDPAGARVEVTEAGLRAYDSTGTETARIQGEGGEFVGGVFRTSDQLPGRVTLSDTANAGTPGLSVEPEDSTGYDVLPSIGPGPTEMHISGGVSTDGALSGAQFGAAGTSIYHNGPGANGTGTWMLANGGEVRLAIRPDRTNQDNESGVWVRPFGATLFTEDATGMGHVSATPTSVSVAQVGVGDPIARSESGIYAAPDRIMIERKAPGSVGRHRLLVDDDGVWVQNVFGPNTVSYNLLETAQDSGWHSTPLASGITGAGSPAWRNKGGVIYFRGTVDAAWVDGWNTVSTGLPAEMRPAVRVIRTSPSTGGANLLFRMGSDGLLQFYRPGSGNVQGDLSGLFYPLG